MTGEGGCLIRFKGGLIMNDKTTQCKQIVDYIRNKGYITSFEVYQNLKVTQLAARITDLESRGLRICQAAHEDRR